jgi:DNA mismatch endonuclease (patch repair protein)
MSRIRGRDNKLEIRLRKALHAKGFRYRLYDRTLPGSPDIVFPSRKAVVFVNGCFWHGHGCSLFRMPKTNSAFWKNKIEGNIERDQKNLNRLNEMGWKSLVVWECAVRGPSRLDFDDVVSAVVVWLNSGETAQIAGRRTPAENGVIRAEPGS